MKTLHLRTRPTERDLADRIYACQHARKNETDLRQDYNLSYNFATEANPEEWTMEEVFTNMESLGWTVSEIDLITVQY